MEIINKQERELVMKKARQAKYRATNKNFKENNKKNQQNYRDKRKGINNVVIEPVVIEPVVIEPVVIEPVIIEKLEKPLYIIKNIEKGISIKNIHKYIKIIGNIHKAITGENISVLIVNKIFLGIYDIEDEKYMVEHMTYIQEANLEVFLSYLKKEYKNNNTRRTYISPFVVITSYLESFNKSYQILTKYMKSMIKIYENEKDDNELNEEEVKKIIDFNPIKINEKLNEITDITDKLIFAIYTLLTPRRLEWANVKIQKEDNDVGNIILLNYEKPEETKIIFNHYKTSMKYNKQILENLPDIFIKILYEYLAKKEKKEGDFLFLNYLKKPYSFNVFGINLTRLFTKLYNHNITLRYIRISYATYKNSFNISNNEIKKMAYEMGHSVKINSRYRKIMT